MFWRRRRNFQWWDVPEGYTVILRRGHSTVTVHPLRKQLYDEAFRVLDLLDAALKRKEEVL